MATITLSIPAENHSEQTTVDLQNHTPLHVMFMAVKNGFEPGDGCIWKMTKSSGSNRDAIGVTDYIKSLGEIGIKDGFTVVLEDVFIG